MLTLLFSLIVLLFSIIIHEIAHGWMAYYLGDPTAKYAGRLTLNPLKHLDPFGSFLLPLFLLFMSRGQGPIFGWAIPVPINPYNFRDRKWGKMKVAVAGPLVNFLLAVIFGISIRFLKMLSLLTFFSIITIYNFAWGMFNLLPLPPLDGFHIFSSFLGEKFFSLRFFLEQYGFFILIFLIFFDLGFIFEISTFLYYLISGQPFIWLTF